MKLDANESRVLGALYERLLVPGKDADGNTVYTISLTLAREVRDILWSWRKNVSN
jgi:hypothetical protein